MYTVFVTGASGFIGSHFIRLLLNLGHKVFALRRHTSRYPINKHPNLTWLTGDLTSDYHNALSVCDSFVHLSAYGVSSNSDNWTSCFKFNLHQPFFLWRNAISANINRFLIVGSCFEYGQSGQRYEFIPVDAPLEPTASYPTSKATASIALKQLAMELQLKLSIHRIFQVYGEGESESRFWPSLRRAALAGEDFNMTEGEQVRDFIQVEAVAEKLLGALSWEALTRGNPRVVNVGTGVPRTLRQFAEHCWAAWGAKGKIKFGELPQRAGEVKRYVPEVSASD